MKKNKNLYKIILDILMTAVLVVLMKITITGILWHELLGIGVFLLFIFHKLININTLSCLIKKFKKIPIRSKSMLILDILLFIDFIVVAGTGILISQELFSSYFTLSNTYLVSAIHHSSAYIGLILISIHIGLHWSCIISIIKDKLHLKNANRARTILSRITAVAIMFLGIQSSYNQNVLSVISQPINSNASSVLGASTAGLEDISLLNDNSIDVPSQNTTAYDVSASDTTTLNEYLSSLFCTLCPEHCPLSNPLCSKGEVLAQEATAEYYSQYGSSSSPLESDNITTDENDKDDDSTENYYHGKGNRRLRETSEDEDNVNTADNNDENAETETLVSKKLPIQNAFDYVSIMGLYIGGTHYLIKIPRKKK